MSTEKNIILRADEVRRLLAGEVVEMRRAMRSQPDVVRDGIAWERGTTSKPYVIGGDFGREPHNPIHCPFGAPGEQRWVKESWRSWRQTCLDDRDDDHRCTEHCDQTYVAYEATPRVGFRPVPDRARITYLDENTPLDRNPKLLGPWTSAAVMPRWASRLTVTIVAVTCERSADGQRWEWVLTARRMR